MKFRTRLLLTCLVLLLSQHTLWGQMGYTQAGEASFYSDKFNGQMTASGERFSNQEMTAAHRVLPFGCKVLVTNVATGATVVVRINDRGPFKKGRIIDLSKTAAAALDIVQAGVGQVKIEVVDVPRAEPPTKLAEGKPPTIAERQPITAPPAATSQTVSESPEPPIAEPKPLVDTPFAPGRVYNLWGKPAVYDGFCLQLGSFNELAQAKAFATRVKDKGWPLVYIRVAKKEGPISYKVIYGVYKTEALARAEQPKLKQKGFDSFLSHHRQ